MREIKFRAWDVNEKCWIPENQISITGKGVFYTTDFEDDDRHWIKETIPIEIVFWTGLLDKNGKEIYEGDIVLHLQSLVGNSRQFYKEHIKPVPPITDYGEFWSIYCLQSCNNIEVIGNIYENPELLR